MLTLFFTIVFIAEIIVAVQLILLIVRIDKAVITFSGQVTNSVPQIKNALYSARIAVNKTLLGVYNFAEILGKQKTKAKQYLIKNALTTVLFFMLSSNGKQVLTAIDLVFTALEFIDRTKNRKPAK